MAAGPRVGCPVLSSPFRSGRESGREVGIGIGWSLRLGPPRHPLGPYRGGGGTQLSLRHGVTLPLGCHEATRLGSWTSSALFPASPNN